MESDKDSKPSFRDYVEEVLEENERDEEQSTISDNLEIEPIKGIAIFVGALFGFGLMIGALTSGQPGVAFLLSAIGVSAVIAIANEKGKSINELMQEVQNQQNKPPKFEPKNLCSNCGWKNPPSNNYCHDCGLELEGEA